MNTGKWTYEEEELLKRLYLEKTDEELVKILNRTIPSIVQKRKKLGLTKNSKEKFEIVCLNCSKKFTVPYSRKEAQFCSRICKGEYTKKNSGSIRNCIVCGKEFYAAGNPKTNHICSRKCFYEYRKTGEIYHCDNCGKEIYVRKYAKKRSKNFFCGTECANEFQTGEKIKLTCKICSKPFEVYPSYIKHSKLRGQTIQYCSIECRNNDPDKIKMLIDLNHLQNKNKSRNKLEDTGIKLIEDLDIEFIEQYLVNNKISVDLFIPDANLIIEWWGDYWHGHQTKIKNGKPDKRQRKRMALDFSQEKYLEKCGYRLLTFWEHEVYNEPEIVKEKIRTAYNKNRNEFER
jgi:very-short-patch-repair endonuclease